MNHLSKKTNSLRKSWSFCCSAVNSNYDYWVFLSDLGSRGRGKREGFILLNPAYFAVNNLHAPRFFYNS